jgi:hypothetical protein
VKKSHHHHSLHSPLCTSSNDNDDGDDRNDDPEGTADILAARHYSSGEPNDKPSDCKQIFVDNMVSSTAPFE